LGLQNGGTPVGSIGELQQFFAVIDAIMTIRDLYAEIGLSPAATIAGKNVIYGFDQHLWLNALLRNRSRTPAVPTLATTAPTNA